MRHGSAQDGADGDGAAAAARARFAAATAEFCARFNGSLAQKSAGTEAVHARSAAVDALLCALWEANAASVGEDVALVAVGGYGRQELFPHSDIDLLFLLSPRMEEAACKELIRSVNQQMWDSGLRVSPLTRTLAECERFDPENVEFTLALLDARLVAGSAAVFAQLGVRVLPRLLERDRKRILKRLAEVTRVRHSRYGDTLFHLEPNLKDCPGGLRDAHVYSWLRRLAAGDTPAPDPDFAGSREFLVLVRVFLHLRHGRDSNVLDWHAQDEAASVCLGLDQQHCPAPDASYWMRIYYRHARSIERTELLLEEEVAPVPAMARVPLLRKLAVESGAGFELAGNRVTLMAAGSGEHDPAQDPDAMLKLFGAMAHSGARLAGESATRLQEALPILSSRLEDGHGLWLHLQRILLGRFAGRALRSMHQLGILELVLPEFHGIDALVIRDAYHRYTVDEHTFVLIDTLHALDGLKAGKEIAEGMPALRARFAALLRDLPHPELLYLAAILHDTGKGHAGTEHSEESARMAARVLRSLELDARETGLVLALVRNHLEMSAALRRDIFDTETVRAFASRVSTPESLRMLTLFTYADISAVHPDALTPWKAENLLSLLNNTTQYLDRLVDGQRLGGAEAPEGSGEEEAATLRGRVTALMPGRSAEINEFLAGLPRRYLLTREPAQVRRDVEMALGVAAPGSSGLEIDFVYGVAGSDLTVITRDRPHLFADLAAVLAAWGMNVVTASAFANAHALVVDTFHFTDPYKTLELNEPELSRFSENVREAIASRARGSVLLDRRRRRPRPVRVPVSNRIDFDDSASGHSTLVQVVAQDVPGLLHVLATTFAAENCNIEVALVDTEGDRAIDVFYLTSGGAKLDTAAQLHLHQALHQALEKYGR